MAVPNLIPCNLDPMSDHPPQPLLVPNFFFNFSYPKCNKYERDTVKDLV